MKSKFLLLTSLVFFSVLTIKAQEKKWNVELNYTLIPQDGIGGDLNYLDLGIKHRFLSTDYFDFGAGINGGFYRNNFDGEPIEGDLTSLIFQPRVFSEIKIPGLARLRPGIGLGYSLINDDTDLFVEGENRSTNNTNGGFNFNFGVSYDFTNRWFIQAQYDFINLRVKDEINQNGQTNSFDFSRKLNNIRIGAGFRF